MQKKIFKFIFMVLYRKECLKAHAHLRSFIDHKQEELRDIFGTKEEGLYRMDMISRKLAKIEVDVKKFWSILDKQIELNRKEKLKAISTLNPDAIYKENQSARVFKNSDFFREKQVAFEESWAKAYYEKKLVRSSLLMQEHGFDF